MTLGFPYASFLLGLVNNGVVNPPADLKTGKAILGLLCAGYLENHPEADPRLRLRYDYDTYPREQYGRMPSASLAVANPTVGGHPGGVVYEATCNCKFAKNYPLAFGPRLGVAYQITPKTVFRGGIGVAYDGTATANTGTGERQRKQCVHGSGLWRCRDATPDAVCRRAMCCPGPISPPGAYPNPNFPANQNGPTSVVDQNAGRPARQIQWSVGLQREITRNTLVEASYVGNRGAWWLSTVLDNYNALSVELRSQAAGLDINSAADRAILRAQIDFSRRGPFPEQAALRRLPATPRVAQSLRPYPQFTSGLAPLWAPQGRTWYDSLQAKVTQRVWHGLEAQYAFTWAKELQLGTEGGHGQRRVQPVAEQDDLRFLPSAGERDFDQLPRARAAGNKIVSLVGSRLGLGSPLSYASGTPILAPTSTNNLSLAAVPRHVLQSRFPASHSVPEGSQLSLHRSDQRLWC